MGGTCEGPERAASEVTTIGSGGSCCWAPALCRAKQGKMGEAAVLLGARGQGACRSLQWPTAAQADDRERRADGTADTVLVMRPAPTDPDQRQHSRVLR